MPTGGRCREEWRLTDAEGEETDCGKTGNDGKSPGEGDAPTLFPSFHVFPHTPFTGDQDRDDQDEECDEEVEDDRTDYRDEPERPWEHWEEAL